MIFIQERNFHWPIRNNRKSRKSNWHQDEKSTYYLSQQYLLLKYILNNWCTDKKNSILLLLSLFRNSSSGSQSFNILYFFIIPFTFCRWHAFSMHLTQIACSFLVIKLSRLPRIHSNSRTETINNRLDRIQMVDNNFFVFKK